MSIVVENDDGSKWEIRAGSRGSREVWVKITAPNGQVIDVWIPVDNVDEVASALRMGSRLDFNRVRDDGE